MHISVRTEVPLNKALGMRAPETIQKLLEQLIRKGVNHILHKV